RLPCGCGSVRACLRLRRPPGATLFPYATLFRSRFGRAGPFRLPGAGAPAAARPRPAVRARHRGRRLGLFLVADALGPCRPGRCRPAFTGHDRRGQRLAVPGRRAGRAGADRVAVRTEAMDGDGQIQQWWLAALPRMLVWARLRVLESGVAEVLDCDGRTSVYESDEIARVALLEA